jgi:hypothetical protein
MGALSFTYAGVLRVDAAGVSSASTLRGVVLPDWPAREWHCEALRLTVSMVSSAQPLEVRVLDDGRGYLDWCCFAPRANVVFRDGDALVAGTGYAERVSMTLPPWSLPWDSLRWGRAHAGERVWVWIELDAPGRRTSWLFVDDRAPALVHLDEARVQSDAGDELFFEAPRAIRQGRIGQTVLSVVPDAMSVFPGRILGLSESKWLSRVRIGSEQGFAIHELVRWPPR